MNEMTHIFLPFLLSEDLIQINKKKKINYSY